MASLEESAGGEFVVESLSGGYLHDATVFEGVSFRVDKDAIGVIGRNGAGKTCLALTLAGALRPHGGVIRSEGLEITSSNSQDRVQRGICLVPEGRQIFGQLTVTENLIASAYAARRFRGARLHRAIADIKEMFPILGEKSGDAAASLSGGQQQLLAIGRALVQDPTLMILDEPSLGLSPKAVDELCDHLIRIASDTNVGLILMEQNSELLTRICEHVFLMESGTIERRLDMSNPDDRQAVRASYLGVDQETAID